ncbi:unnamed protein product [Amoebophrya sp. A120]|nr:unnamed protein product [Amoebophrya sp. A120]|eukprot:GSA120T00025605001.1
MPAADDNFLHFAKLAGGGEVQLVQVEETLLPPEEDAALPLKDVSYPKFKELLQEICTTPDDHITLPKATLEIELPRVPAEFVLCVPKGPTLQRCAPYMVENATYMALTCARGYDERNNYKPGKINGENVKASSPQSYLLLDEDTLDRTKQLALLFLHCCNSGRADRHLLFVHKANSIEKAKKDLNFLSGHDDPKPDEDEFKNGGEDVIMADAEEEQQQDDGENIKNNSDDLLGRSTSRLNVATFEQAILLEEKRRERRRRESKSKKRTDSKKSTKSTAATGGVETENETQDVGDTTQLDPVAAEDEHEKPDQKSSDALVQVEQDKNQKEEEQQFFDLQDQVEKANVLIVEYGQLGANSAESSVLLLRKWLKGGNTRSSGTGIVCFDDAHCIRNCNFVNGDHMFDDLEEDQNSTQNAEQDDNGGVGENENENPDQPGLLGQQGQQEQEVEDAQERNEAILRSRPFYLLSAF